LQTSTRAAVTAHFFGVVVPTTTVVSSTVDLLQSVEVVLRYDVQVEVRLSPSLSVNGFAVRAQW
jgi:hypothetical protein